jgi:formate hydrogenlyase transcriptional activator
MAVVAFSSQRSESSDSPNPFERLLVMLSTALSSMDAETATDVIDRALEDVGTAFGMDECAMLTFDGPAVGVVASWAVAPTTRWTDDDVSATPWLARQLARNTVVAMNATTEVPQMAAPDRAHAERKGVGARLAVPITIDGRVAYGLVIGTHQRHASWDVPVIDRLRLVGEILGGGLVRYQQADALRSRQPQAERVAGVTSAERLYLEEEERNRREQDEIIGESPSLRVAMNRLAQVAPLDATVLLLGETGTGKELFARAIHQRSRRRDRTLVKVNCAALPPSLIESELFGHERGAFTGAVSTRQGRFELADGGTIFLDEIGDLAPELQAKLLRVLQEGEFERVGSSKTRQVHVRVIAGTHVDLEKAMVEGRFRADLYYRLSVFPISLPPLRDRPGDIEQLVWFFIHRRQRDIGRRISRIPPTVMEVLQRHDWPGNVRELENVIERALICSADGILRLDDPLRSAANRLPPECGDNLDAIQRVHIERVLRDCGGRINGSGNAADRLGLHPNTLRFRIKKLGVVNTQRQRAAAD